MEIGGSGFPKDRYTSVHRYTGKLQVGSVVNCSQVVPSVWALVVGFQFLEIDNGWLLHKEQRAVNLQMNWKPISFDGTCNEFGVFPLELKASSSAVYRSKGVLWFTCIIE